MPFSLANNDIVELVFEGTLDAQQTISTFHYKVSGVTATNDGFEELRLFIGLHREDDRLFDAYQAVTSDQLNHLDIYAQVVYPIRYRYVTDDTLAETGAVDALSFPANVQASITRAAERAGRRYVSHLSIPAVPITVIENSFLTAPYLTDLQTLATEIITARVNVSGTQFTPVIFHPQYTPVTDNIVVAFPQETSRVIRRRTVGLGS